MSTQMMICIGIFVVTLVSYMMNKIPMWLTAMLSLAALFLTGCIDANGALAGFSNNNTILMATMFIVAAGFRRTSMVDGMCNMLMSLTKGSFRLAYFGYLLLAALLTNFIASPMVVFAILWALFLGPKFTPAVPIMPIETRNQTGQSTQKLSPMVDKIGIFIFFGTILTLIFSAQLGQPTWFIALVGSLLMVLFGVVDQKTALRDIPWDMLMLFVGALALGSALTNTGAGDMIGNALASAVGGTRNNYVLGALFFVIPFLLTQFMLNRAVSAVFVPICLLTCSALGANPIGLVILVNAGSLTAFLTPMATPAVPMCMAEGGYDLKSLVKSGALITLILPIIYVAYTMTVFPAFK